MVIHMETKNDLQSNEEKESLAKPSNVDGENWLGKTLETFRKLNQTNECHKKTNEDT